MKPIEFSHEHLVNIAQFNSEDVVQVNQCRRQHNKLGFGYQLAFVKLLNRFPNYSPFELLDSVLSFTSIQLSIPPESIQPYTQRRQTIDEHRERIRHYLGLRKFGEAILNDVKQFVFEEACRLEQTPALLAKTELFLRERHILSPAEETLKRLIGNQREEAKQYIFNKIHKLMTEEHLKSLDDLIDTEGKHHSDFNFLKTPAGRPSPPAMLKLTNKMEQIQSTKILDIDLSWLNNNFQRVLFQYAKRCTAAKLRSLQSEHRYAALVCFLWQSYRDTMDQMVDMYDKLMNKIYNHAQKDIDQHNASQRKRIKASLISFQTLAELILDEDIEDIEIRPICFNAIDKENLTHQMKEVDEWLHGKNSHVFNLVKERFSYIRQFSPAFLKHVQLQSEGTINASLFEAVDILRGMNDENKRKLPEAVPVDFIPKNISSFVQYEGEVNKAAWECALLTKVRDEIKSGNISVGKSKSFGKFNDFFIPKKQWEEKRESFFKRAGLPSNPNDVKSYLTNRLNNVFDKFLEHLPENTYACIEDDSWHLSVDATEKLTPEAESNLDNLKKWLSKNMRVIKLPELLIEVDNDLKISRFFMPVSQQESPQVEDVCAVLATIMAHGCNIGTYTMSQLIEGISYSRLKHISDWSLTEEAQRTALAVVVNAISQLDVTQAWGEGKTSSSDGQRFSLKRKVLHQTYSPKFSDFAIEFYTFVADNYAPFYNLPIECTDRDAPFVLDGILYNESDLPLEDHYVDTHGYTENNFAAFAMLGKRFSPRIRGLHKQRIYRIDKSKDYQALTPLVSRKDHTIHMNWISDQWDRMGHFYASLECGHVTASTAMKRLNGFTGKNHFYRANRELGRVFKTEHILQYMSDQALRQRTRRGLLKGEQIHALARDLNYGKRGRISQRDLQEQRNSSSCLTLTLASIIYWQAKEINRVIVECDPEKVKVDLSLMEHISPIAWENVILYGEYVLNKDLIEV